MKKGTKHTAETRVKLRESHLRQVPWNKGKPWSEETKEKIRLAGRGQNNALGYKWTDEQKKKVSGVNASNWQGGLSLNYQRKIMGKRPEQCEVCGAFGRIHFDHDHATKKFRGWVCVRCNLILGLAHDNSETLTALADYLRRKKN